MIKSVLDNNYYAFTFFIGNVFNWRDDIRVNGEIMFSTLFDNNATKLADNDLATQKSDSVTNQLHMALYEDDTQQIQDMNFTLISTLRATGATTSMSSENISVTTERYKDFQLGNELANVSLAISKVR
jgi:predicted patatin/cPLA2 family phospholipase